MHWQPRNRHKGESDDMVVEGNSTFTKFLATIPKIWKFESAALKLRIDIRTKIRMPRTWEITMNGQNLRMTVVRSERRTERIWEIHLNFRNAVLEVFDERPAVPAGPNHNLLLG